MQETAKEGDEAAENSALESDQIFPDPPVAFPIENDSFFKEEEFNEEVTNVVNPDVQVEEDDDFKVKLAMQKQIADSSTLQQTNDMNYLIPEEEIKEEDDEDSQTVDENRKGLSNDGEAGDAPKKLSQLTKQKSSLRITRLESSSGESH